MTQIGRINMDSNHHYKRRLELFVVFLSSISVWINCGSDDETVTILTPVAENVQILNPYTVEIVLDKPAPKNVSITVSNPLPNLMTVSPLEFEILKGEGSAFVQLKQINTLGSGESHKGTMVITLNTDPPVVREWDFFLVGPGN